MHRTIDAFSDRHPAVHRRKRILTSEYGRLSGVIVDVFYDHVLARRWAEALIGYASGSPKDRPHVVGATDGDTDRSETGVLDPHPIGIRTRNV
jgi:hypothetical protein